MYISSFARYLKLFALFGLLAFGGNVVAQDGEKDATAEVASEEALAEESPEDEHGDSESHTSATDDHGDSHGDDSHGIELHNDPTHANLSDKTWALLDFRNDMALFSGVVFLLLLGGLWAKAWTPIMEGLEKRERGIADNIANAEKASAEADAKLADYEAKLASANEEAAAIVADARKDAEAAGQKLVADAQEEAARLRERATADIESAKRVALGELASQSTDVAMSLAQRIVGREVKADDHQSLIQDMLGKLPSEN